jgi:hypothetical protein
MPAKSEINKRSRSHRVVTAACPQWRVVKQGATLSDGTRQCTLAVTHTDVPAGVVRDSGGGTGGAVGSDVSVGQDGEYPIEIAATVAVGDQLVVDSTGAIGRVKPVGATAKPYWVVGIAREAVAFAAGVTANVEFRPFFVPA